MLILAFSSFLCDIEEICFQERFSHLYQSLFVEFSKNKLGSHHPTSSFPKVITSEFKWWCSCAIYRDRAKKKYFPKGVGENPLESQRSVCFSENLPLCGDFNPTIWVSPIGRQATQIFLWSMLKDRLNLRLFLFLEILLTLLNEIHNYLLSQVVDCSYLFRLVK